MFILKASYLKFASFELTFLITRDYFRMCLQIIIKILMLLLVSFEIEHSCKGTVRPLLYLNICIFAQVQYVYKMSYSYTPEKSHVLIRDYKVLRNVICNKEHGREGGREGWM